MKDKFMKNGVFSLEYDKETLRDMVLELQEENQELKLELSGYRQAILNDKEMLGLKQENQKYKGVIDKSINNSQYWIDYYTRLNSDERIALRLQENIDILKGSRINE